MTDDMNTATTYYVRMPIEFPSGYEIKDTPTGTNLCGHDAELDTENGNYLLIVRGFGSEDAAANFLKKLYAGICWTSLELKTGIKATSKPQKVHHADDPEQAGKNIGLNRPIDVLFDTHTPAIVPENARTAKLTGGSVTVRLSNPAVRFFGALKEGLEKARPRALQAGEPSVANLETAIELYILSYFEPRTIPRFLIQCSALETLAPPGGNLDESKLEVLDRWVAEANSKGHPELASRVGNLKSVSHGERISNFARELLQQRGAEEIDAKVQQLRKAYSARGKFLHNGDATSVDESATHLQDILPLLLKSVLERK